MVNNKKKTCPIMDFAIPVDLREKIKESEKIETSTWKLPGNKKKKLKNQKNMKETVILIVTGELGTISNGLGKGLEDLEIRRQVETPIIKICQNTEKSPEDTRRHAVIQTPVRDHQPTLMIKTLKE